MRGHGGLIGLFPWTWEALLSILRYLALAAFFLDVSFLQLVQYFVFGSLANSLYFSYNDKTARFIPDKPYDSEDTSNENEFLLQFYDRQEDMELACHDSKEEKCYWAWHNHWLPEDIDGGHTAPLGADYE